MTSRVPVEHDLKVWPEVFQAIWDNEKHFELRKNDRGYQVGDTLMLREWSADHGYSGRAVRVEVPYLLDAWPGLKPGFVVMSIERVAQFANYQSKDERQNMARPPQLTAEAMIADIRDTLDSPDLDDAALRMTVDAIVSPTTVSQGDIEAARHHLARIASAQLEPGESDEHS